MSVLSPAENLLIHGMFRLVDSKEVVYFAEVAHECLNVLSNCIVNLYLHNNEGGDRKCILQGNASCC